MALAEEAAVKAYLNENPTWKRDGDAINAEFEFKDFTEAIEFVNNVAGIAEHADHHPDIDIRWNKVMLVLSTHSEGGITAKDLEVGTEISALV